jgi:RNA:NAD 2'-phosphotransferase (TPT1/KptA family)
MDGGGYVSIRDLLSNPQLRGTTQDFLLEIVLSCPKQRFGMEQRADGIFLRANQGHTLQVSEQDLLKPLSLADASRLPMVVHGTFRKNLGAIMASGLNRMARQHVHFATSLPKSTQAGVSGLRAGTDIVISIDIRRAITDGIPFFVSANGVVLTPGFKDTGLLPPCYISAVHHLHRDGSISPFKLSEP